LNNPFFNFSSVVVQKEEIGLEELLPSLNLV
jgi:hypothetical protein